MICKFPCDKLTTCLTQCTFR